MKKDGKHITRWKTGATKLQGAAYLREMAEQGWILEGMNHLMYTFREEEPQYLRYRLEEREAYLTEEERAEYAKDGWQEVCHYELEYVFVKERDLFVDEQEVNQDEIVQELDWKIAQERKNEKSSRYGQLAVLGIGWVTVFLMSGFSKDTFGLALHMAVRFLPWIFLAYLLSKRRRKKLQEEKEDVLDGTISDEYTDWRASRKATILLVAVLLIGLGVWIFYEGGFNEKTFDMPKEVSYADIPAVRLERLTEEKLTRTGDSIDPEMEGIRLNANMGEGSMYTLKKNMGGFDNYGVDHRFLLKTEEKVETHQCMQLENGRELNLKTMYYRFRDVQDAAREYLDLVRDEIDDDEYWKELEMDFPERQLIVQENPLFYNQHICKEEWPEGTAYHLVCYGEENQIMELNFYYSDGDITEEQLLKEIEKVFAVQAK